MNTTGSVRGTAHGTANRHTRQRHHMTATPLLTVFCLALLISACGKDDQQNPAVEKVAESAAAAIDNTKDVVADANEQAEDVTEAVSDQVEIAAANADSETTEAATDLKESVLANAVPESDESEYTPTDAAVFGDELPYPVYPNGRKYRVGGENGLKIVVFETVDTFAEVDTFYQQITSAEGMERLKAMPDYVRYSQGGDEDPWATHRPGIVIHQFNDDDERAAVGAAKGSVTNIIMSY